MIRLGDKNRKRGNEREKRDGGRKIGGIVRSGGGHCFLQIQSSCFKMKSKRIVNVCFMN